MTRSSYVVEMKTNISFGERILVIVRDIVVDLLRVVRIRPKRCRSNMKGRLENRNIIII